MIVCDDTATQKGADVLAVCKNLLDPEAECRGIEGDGVSKEMKYPEPGGAANRRFLRLKPSHSEPRGILPVEAAESRNGCFCEAFFSREPGGLGKAQEMSTTADLPVQPHVPDRMLSPNVERGLLSDGPATLAR
jgi:hypothetical protein